MYSSPRTLPLERLQVTDGLLLTAERWRVAHEYHRQRQNVHYQSLHQPGIVCGLKVGVVAAPEEFAAQYRDRRWLKVQPGVAIDTLGNPIIVPEAIVYRLASEPPRSGTAVIYLVLSYVDPDRLQRSVEPELVQETFRIDEKTTPPDALEVELCRIVIQTGSVCLEENADVFSPSINHVDLRYRQQVQARPLGMVSVAQVNGAESAPERWAELVRSLPALYPGLGAVVAQTALTGDSTADLLTLDSNQLTFDDLTLENLKQHLASGGTVLVNALGHTRFFKLALIRQELQQALATVRRDVSLEAEQQQVEAELAEVETSLQDLLETIAQPVKTLAEQISFAIHDASRHDLGHDAGDDSRVELEDDLRSLDRHHPLRSQPFVFAQFPVIHGMPIEILAWGGIVLVIGDLSEAWALTEGLMLPRETIRAAQELGINILHFAWKRKQLVSV
ncbi:MAG: DUF4159 domain-containing protein [Timaviella obliquedivisa GSE-PSE-MK23-08B]|jgi:hypothetical protein|nr:DUF4159 domain-containing protein [Timaviella obliquedivisa GSE-PSE-MK23-08B]